MIKLANSVGNHHKIRSQCYLGGGDPPQSLGGGAKIILEAHPLCMGGSLFLDGLLWPSFNHPKEEND